MHLNVEGIIPILGGTYATLAAYGKITLSKNAEKEARWRSSWGKPLKIIGPLVVIFGFATLCGLLR